MGHTFRRRKPAIGLSARLAFVILLTLIPQSVSASFHDQHGAGSTIAPGLDGEVRLFSFASPRTSEANPAVHLAAGIPTARTFAATESTLVRNLLILTALIIAGLIAAWLLAERWLGRRIRRLARSVDRLCGGERGARTGQSDDIHGLGQMARALDDMAAALDEDAARRHRAEAALRSDIAQREQAEEALRQARDQLQAVLDATPAAISWVGSDLCYRGINRYLAESLGLPGTAVAGEPIGYLGTSPEIGDFVRDFFAGGLDEATREVVAHSKGGVQHYLVVARKYQEGQAAVLVGTDVTTLRRSEERYRIISGLMSDYAYAFRVADDGAVVREWTTGAFAEITGYSPVEADARGGWDSLIHPDDLPTAQRRAQTLVKGQADVSEYRIITKQGEVRWLRDHGRPVWDEGSGRVVRIHGAASDITERKQAELALLDSGRTVRAMLDAIADSVILVDREGTILALNETAALRMGWPASEYVGTDVRRYFSPEQARARWACAEEAFASGKPVLFEDQRDGCWYEYTVYPVRNAEGGVDQVLIYGRDVTPHKDAEEALRNSRKQLRELTARLADAGEGERRRLAQELHDRVGQNLTALSINLIIVSNLLPSRTAASVQPRLADSLELVSETVEHIRDVMAELRPPVLDDYGLLAALRWYGQRFAQRTGLTIRTQGADLTPRLPLTTEMTLFRIAQEALTNAARHAQARQVSVAVEAATSQGPDSVVRLIIADDGTGFDPKLLVQPNGRAAWGLMSMTERAESIGGRLVIDTAQDRGTRVIVEFKPPSGICQDAGRLSGPGAVQ